MSTTSKAIATHKALNQDIPVRLQEYGVGIFQIISTKSALKKALKRGEVLVDGKVASTAIFISGGELIELTESEVQSNKREFDFQLEVIFEDEFLAVIHKPAGIEVSGNRLRTIDNALPQNLKKSTEADAVRPRPVHRLDYPTSGLLLVGKTSSGILRLNQLFEQKQICKKYYAVAIGVMETEGVIDLQVDDKEAQSLFRVIKTVPSERFSYLNLVELSPKTGRRHQLRKHLASLGNPILGDKEYGTEPLILRGKGLYLHAFSLKFVHPFTLEKVEVALELPKKFKKLFELL